MSTNRPHSATRPARCRPRLERLEDRALPSVTVLSAAPNPANGGQAVMLTATVTESGLDVIQPGTGVLSPGTVTFFDGSTSLGTVNVTPKSGTTNQGVAQLTTSALGAGAHALSAQYSGDSILVVGVTAGSTSNTVSEVVSPPPATPVNVSGQVPVALGRVGPVVVTGHGRHGHRHTVRNRFGVQLILRNVSGTPVQGPLELVVDNLPRKVSLVSPAPAGFTQANPPVGDPYERIDVGLFSPGMSVGLTLQFRATRARDVIFATRVFAGNGTV